MKPVFVIFLLPLQLFAQDITGVWIGTLYNDTTRQFIRYELAISEYNGKLSGYSHTIFVIDGFENTGLKSIKVKKAGEEFHVEDDKLIYNNYTEPPAKHVKTYSELVLSQNDTAMVLSGPWNTNRTRVYTRLTGNIFLQKKKKIEETLIITALENFGLTASLSFMTAPAQSLDLAIINNRGFNPAKPGEAVEIAGDIVSNTIVPANSGIQQAVKRNGEEEPKSEKVLNKEHAAKGQALIGSTQLAPADKSIQQEKTAKVIIPGIISAKPAAQQDNNQQDAGKKISNKVLDKEAAAKEQVQKGNTQLDPADKSIQQEKTVNVIIPGIIPTKSATQKVNSQQDAGKKSSNTVLNKETAVKEQVQTGNTQLTPADKSIQQEKTGNVIIPGIISAKSAAQEVNNQEDAGKKSSNTVLNKESSVPGKDVKKLPVIIAEIPAPKNEATNIATTTTEIHQVEKQQEGRISDGALNTAGSDVDKAIKETLSRAEEISKPKSDTSNFVTKKPGTQQIKEQPKAAKEVFTMVLKKDESVDIKKVKQPVSQPAAKIATRKIETIRSVDIKSDSLLLTLYDNGEIDGDTVSVLMNGRVIMPNQGLMTKAINKTIYLTPAMGDSIVLIMYAENLGSIAPNTGLLVIRDGDDIYEIRFTGDLEKNSSIVLKRKKKIL